MSKIKVAHLTSVHPYNDPRIFFKECSSLAKNGYEVFLVAPVDGDFEENGVQVRGVGKPKNRLWRLIITVHKVFFKALKTRAKIVHLHDPELLYLVPFFFFLGKKIIYDIHEDYVTSIRLKSYLPKPLRWFLALTFRLFERRMSLLCHLVVAEKYYKQDFPDALEVLNYPLFDADSKEDFTNQIPINLNESYHWFFYSGNVTKDRGALAQLSLLEASKDTAIFIIGKCSSQLSEEMYAYLTQKEISHDRLVILGVNQFVSKNWILFAAEMRDWVAGLALFPDNPHYTSKELTKFFEYIQSEIPLLVSNFPAWKHFVNRWSCGYAVDYKDEYGLQIAIKTLLDDNHRKKLKMSLQKNKMTFSWGSEERKLLELYKKILNSRFRLFS